MTLPGRLSVFFLGALALVLFGFSAALYLLVRAHLHRQVDDRLESALNTLVAAAEVKPDGVEWEAHDRHLALGFVRWAVCERDGRLVDPASAEEGGGWLSGHQLPEIAAPHSWDTPGPDGGAWRLAQRRLQSSPSGRANTGHGDQDDLEPAKKYPVLVFTVALPLQPVSAELRNLVLLLSGLSVGLWLLVALAGRWLARRALAPLTRMAHAVRSMRVADLGERLPAAGTEDELDNLGLAFNDLLARLHESFERQRRFTADASHQLRTPLAGVLGQVEVALRRPRSPEEYRAVLALVREQSLHLQRVVEMLLFLARADAETPLSDRQALDLSAWLREHLQAWSGHARASDLRLPTVPERPLLVEAHAPLLGQLIDNLLENACKYSAAGAPIVLSLDEEAGRAVLAIEDAGCGLRAEDLPHLFEPFYRSEQARRLGVAGVGLGLAVARRIALALGGDLRAEGLAGQGSRFVLRLPRVTIGEARAPINPIQPIALGT